MKIWWQLAAVWCLSGNAFAAPGDFYGELFGAGQKNSTRARFEFRPYAKENAAGRSFGLQQTRFDASAPIVSGETSSWRASAHADYDHLESGATFSNGRKMPNRLWDLGTGVSHTRELSDGRTIGGSFTVSSASNQPFLAGRDLGFSLNLTYKVPQNQGNAWIFFLGFSNTRNFLNYLPLPGVAYFFQAHPKLRMLVGLPFVTFFWMPADLLTVTALYFPIRTAELKVAYGNPRGLQPYALVRYQTRNYRLSDRIDTNDKLFLDEGFAQAGLNLPVAKGTMLDLGGGVSFARRYYLAQKATERSGAPGIAADNAAFAAVKVSASF